MLLFKTNFDVIGSGNQPLEHININIAIFNLLMSYTFRIFNWKRIG